MPFLNDFRKVLGANEQRAPGQDAVGIVGLIGFM